MSVYPWAAWGSYELIHRKHSEQRLGHRQCAIKLAIYYNYSVIFSISLKISGYQFWAQCAVHLSRQKNITQRWWRSLRHLNMTTNTKNGTAWGKREKPKTLLIHSPTRFLKPTTTGRDFCPQVTLKMQAAAQSLWLAEVWNMNPEAYWAASTEVAAGFGGSSPRSTIRMLFSFLESQKAG